MLEKGQICVLNKVMFHYFRPLSGDVNRNNGRRGPSKVMSIDTCTDVSSTKASFYDPADDVGALAFASWPSESINWISKKGNIKWPTKQMIKTISEHTCLLVPVGHVDSDRRMTEWRISYSFTERYLMFSMNIIQLQCYVALKIIRKTYLGKKITSYHLKNLLFYTVSRTKGTDWTQNSLFGFILLCLKTLSFWVHVGYCPNFIDSKVNLFRRKLSIKLRKKLYERITFLIDCDYTFLLKIKIDSLGYRISADTTTDPIFSGALSKSQISSHINATLSYAESNYKRFFINDFFQRDGFLFERLLQCLKSGTSQEKAAAMTLLPGLLGHVAAIEISNSISKGTMASRNAVWFLLIRTIHDCFSMGLKCATVCYRLGFTNIALNFIKSLEFFHSIYKVYTSCSLRYAVWNGDILTEDSMFGNCVRFVRQEIPICPPALIFEMFRTTKNDRKYRYEVA